MNQRLRQNLHHEANRRAGEARPADARAMGTGSRLSKGQTLMAAPTFRQLKDEYAALWHSMIVKPDKLAALDRIARKLIAGKPRYQSVAGKTGVPWAAIALIHQMECGGDWTLNIAQGDPWNRRSVHVPKGRGPFASWEDAAI